ncbi:MAG: type IV pilus assembly protein PilM, partial [Legionellales bacterium]
DIESFAVERAAQQFVKALPAVGKDQIIAIIDIGMNYTHLFVLHGMRSIFSREEKFGGSQLLHAITEHYKITPEQALLARDQQKLPIDYGPEVLGPFKENILLQIKRSLQFFYSSGQHSFVDHILLAGGLARQPGLASLIQEQLGVTTTIANPFASMSLSRMVNVESITNDAPALMVACGLALRTL